jgi:phosphonate transport system permease protein
MFDYISSSNHGTNWPARNADRIIWIIGSLLLLAGFLLPWAGATSLGLTGMRIGSNGYFYLFFLPLIGFFGVYDILFNSRKRPLYYLSICVTGSYLLAIFLAVIATDDTGRIVFGRSQELGLHVSFRLNSEEVILKQIGDVGIGFILTIFGLVFMFLANLFRPADTVPRTKKPVSAGCATTGTRFDSLEELRPLWTLRGEYGPILAWLICGLLLIYTYNWCGMSPSKLWENRGNAADYLFGRELSEQDKAYIEDQRTRAPEIEAQGLAREYQDNKYRSIPIEDHPSLTEKFKENEELVAKFLAEMTDDKKTELRKKAFIAAKDEKRGGYFPPESAWPKIKGYLVALLETVAIAIWGTLLAIVCAIPVSLLAAKNTLELIVSGDGKTAQAMRNFCQFGVRRFLDACRGFNEFVMALIFVAVIGLGPFAGILALWIHTFGILGKVFSEQIEAIEGGQLEALSSTGAGVDQAIAFSVLPQVMPGFVSYSLLRFESNVRSAAILGFVGAGGIGFLIFDKLNGYLFREVCTMMVIIIVSVGIIDHLCGMLRNRFI